ncbi:MAG: sensor histidine kinase [Hellea sp.]
MTLRWVGSFLLVAVICLQSVLAFAAEPLALKKDSGFYVPLTPYLEGYVDDTRELGIEDVRNNPDDFMLVTTRYPDFGLTEGRVWMKASVLNSMDVSGTWRLDINRQYYSEIDIYLSSSDESPRRLIYYTNTNNFSDRQVPDRLLGVDFDISGNSKVDIYIGFRSDSTSYMPVGIGTPEAVMSRHSQEHTINWILNGALLAIIAFSLMMIPVIGWRLSLSFSLYILVGFIYVFHADGYTFQHIWPHQPMKINDPLNLSFMVSMPVFGLIFSRMMFNFKKHSPRFDLYLIGFIAMAACIALLSFPIYQSQSIKVFAYYTTPIGSITQVVAGSIAIRRKLLGAIPYTIGAVIVLSSFVYATAAHLSPGNYNLDSTLDYGHMALIAECLAFAAAIVIRLSGLRRERDRALQAELLLAQDKLKLSSDLQASQANYINARKMSDIRRNQLSSVSHDLQQPLASLRQALGRIGGPDEDAKQQMYTAFDYLESLARDQITAGKIGTTAHLDGSLERFPVRTLLDNIYEMFKDEAASKGLNFRYRPMDATVTSDPIGLMRAINNLVSNAIKHTEEGGVLLAARRRHGRVRIEVWDTGAGMTQSDLDRYTLRHEKSENSQGAGLGLAIVTEISEALDLDFEMHSKPRKGSSAFLYVPHSA